MENKKPVLGITQGDPNGVGLELILRTFQGDWMYQYFTPVVYANPKTFVYYKKMLELQEPGYFLVKSAEEAKEGKLNLVLSSDATFEVKCGEASAEAGKEALLSLDRAIADAQKGHLEALVTLPLDKHTVAANADGFSGHTGYLAEKLGTDAYLMMLISEELKVALVTEHVPITELKSHINQEKIATKLKVLHQTLVTHYHLNKPRIAVLGLNPHAGDGGTLGKEEQEMIIPAIKEVFDEGMLVYGPYAADAFFGSGQYKSFDGVMAMYHDQGLIPFKTLAFYDGVNFTAGLPLVRTSPDHGTAYNLAGKGEASLVSFRNALFDAVHLIKSAKQYEIDHEQPLPYTEFRREKFRIDF